MATPNSATDTTAQSALYGETTGGSAVYSAGHTHQASRSFFIIDKSRMVGEEDTVEGAKVVYLPQSEFNKELYQSRCSCLIGVADVYRNLTGDFPQSLTMSGCCYACKLLEPNFFMFLLGRPFEPTERVQTSLQHISDIFHFYYRSPEIVMNKSCGNWNIFTTNMTFIFSKINDYVFRDPHSIPFMFQTLPYTQKGPRRKRSRLFMLASHILRSCQEHESIVGGCVTYKIVCSQLSPRVMGKLQVVSGGGIELNTKSILAENIAPETVWVLEIYLSPEEVDDVMEVQKDLRQYQRTYDNMAPNPSLIDSAGTFASRFQSSASPSSSRNNTSRPKRTSRLSSWRSHTQAHTSSERDYYNLPKMSQSRTAQEDGRMSLNSDQVAVYRAGDSTISVSSLRTSRGGGQASGETGVEKEKLSEREMPRLHNRSKRVAEYRPYNDPDEFINISVKVASSPSTSRTHTTSHTQPSAQPPVDNSQSSPVHSDLVPLSLAIPASLSIPITEQGKTPETTSPLLSVTSSSVEEERFATPSPNFPISYSNQEQSELQQEPTDTSVSTERQGSSSSVDVYKPSNPPHPLSPPDQHDLQEHDAGKPESALENTSHKLSPDTSSRQKLEESNDFVDFDVLDQLILETRLQKKLETQQARPHLHGREEGSSRVGPREDHDRKRLLAMRTNDSASNDTRSHLPPPPLPPRHQPVADSTSGDVNLGRVRASDLMGSSGEFTVVESPPLSHKTAEGERSREGSSPPPSPPPRGESRRRNRDTVDVAAVDYLITERDDNDLPPTPPPRERGRGSPAAAAAERSERLHVMAPERRSDSSLSLDYQHRDLTQQERNVTSSAESERREREDERIPGGEEEEEEGDGEGRQSEELTEGGAGGRNEEGEVDEKQESEVDVVLGKRSSTCVDPPDKEVESQVVPENSTDEVASVSSTVKTLTSDEDESDEETIVSPKLATRGYAHTFSSTPSGEGYAGMSLMEESTSTTFHSLSASHFSPTPRASLSLYQLKTPETTLHVPGSNEPAEEVVSDSENEGGGRTRGINVGTDMTRIHQTLGRNIQPPAVQPAPELEPWCIYVQRQFNTMIILVAKAGLQDNHSLLTQMWKGLLPQLFALDQGLEGLEEHEPRKGSYNLAVYQNADQFCAVECRKALYKFRHAIRFTHLEYQKNPDLCQVSLLNAPKMVSQKVMGREVFYHFQKSSFSDVFNATAMVTRNVRQTTHPSLSGDTPAQFL